MRHTLCFTGLALGMALGFPAAAQAQKPADCTAALTALGLTVPPAGQDPCVSLIGEITQKATAEAAQIALKPDQRPSPIGQSDLQSRTQTATAVGGTPASGEAAPTVQPAGVAAGTIAAFGTNSDQGALAALSINPAVLFLGDLASRGFAKASRFSDITVFVPVTSPRDSGGGTEPAQSSKLRYFGVRVRINVNGLSAGDEVWNKADELIQRFTGQTLAVAEVVKDALAKASDVKGCATALFNETDDEAAIAAACGQPVILVVDQDAAEELRGALTRVRRKADSRYFGADIRLDVGDPTLGAVADAAGRFLFGGFSAGARKEAADANGDPAYTVGIRGRLGGRSAKLDSESSTELALEWGAGFEIVRFIGDDEVSLSLGVEGRHGNSEERLFSQLQSNVVMVRGSLSLPLTTGNSIGLNLAYPVAGKGRDGVSPVFSVTFNWSLLLAKELRH